MLSTVLFCGRALADDWPTYMHDPRDYSLILYNVRGQVVRTLAKGRAGREGLQAGLAVWNGADDRGNRAGSGVYYYRLACGARAMQGSVVMIK